MSFLYYLLTIWQYEYSRYGDEKLISYEVCILQKIFQNWKMNSYQMCYKQELENISKLYQMSKAELITFTG
jgi:hypothetical protein